MPTIQNEKFPDYNNGVIKSLGSWGGDFVLATGDEKSVDYFTEYAGISYFYNKQIDNLRTDTLDKDTEKYLQNSFVRYNDTQDRHRKRNTWRELLPLLEEALTNNLK